MFINIGKTYELIRKAVESNTPILVTDKFRASSLEKYAKNLGFDIKCVYPVATGIFISDNYKGEPIGGDIMVDNADEVLSILLHSNNIEELNVTGMNISYVPDTFICQYPKKPERIADITQFHMNIRKE